VKQDNISLMLTDERDRKNSRMSALGFRVYRIGHRQK